MVTTSLDDGSLVELNSLIGSGLASEAQRQWNTYRVPYAVFTQSTFSTGAVASNLLKVAMGVTYQEPLCCVQWYFTRPKAGKYRLMGHDQQEEYFVFEVDDLAGLNLSQLWSLHFEAVDTSGQGIAEKVDDFYQALARIGWE